MERENQGMMDSASTKASTRKRRIGLALLLAGVIGLAGACAPAAPAPTPTAPPPATAKPAAAAPTATPVPPIPTPKKVVKLTYHLPLPSLMVATVALGIEKGLYREESLDLEVTYLGSAEALKGMVAGRFDIATFTPAQVFGAVEQGADLQIIAAHSRPRDVLFVKKEIRALKDLEGRTVAISVPGDLTTIVLNALLDKYKVDKGKVATISIGNNEARIAALLAGKVDATLGQLENLEAVEKTPDFRALAVAIEELPQFKLAGALIAQGKLVREQPGVVQAFVNARAKATRYAVEHRDEVVALTMKMVKTEDKAGMERGFDDSVKYRIIDPNLDFDERDIDTLQAAAIEGKQLKAKLPFEKVATRKFTQEMLRTLGEYKYR